MLVYVINKNGQPLMPTERCGKVRRLLRDGKAKVIKRCPFTIQLLYESKNNVQEVTLGVDAGSKHIGISATTESKVLYEADVEVRNDIVDLLSTRRELRRSRRNRKIRYRKPRFLNRVKAKKEGWLAPGVEAKVGTHLAVINKLQKFLPISRIVVEVAAFDTQLLKAKELGLPLPEGTDYQKGEQLYSWNVREYVLFRDNHICRCCKGKSKDKVLETHHIQSRKAGGDAPNNLVTLCSTCHKGYHAGRIILPEDIKRGNRYNDAAFMGIMRWKVYSKLKETYPNVALTYGYLTKNDRIENNLPKEHFIDARVISGHPTAKTDGTVYYQKKVRCHNRQLHKQNPSKGGIRKRNQSPYLVKGYRLFDKVLFENQECFIFGRRASGYFDLRKLDGTVIHRSASYKKLTLLEMRNSYLTERRMALLS